MLYTVFYRPGAVYLVWEVMFRKNVTEEETVQGEPCKRQTS